MDDLFDRLSEKDICVETHDVIVCENEYFIITGWNHVDIAEDQLIKIINVSLKHFGKEIVQIEDNLAIIVFSKIEIHRKKDFYKLLYVIQIILKSKCLNIFIRRGNLHINECIQAKETAGKNKSGFDQGFETFWGKFEKSDDSIQDYSKELPDEIKSLIKKRYNKVGELVIINEDSPPLPNNTLDYIKCITDSIELPTTDSQHELYTNFEWLRPSATKRFIPIFLMKDMPTYEEHWERIDIKGDYKKYKPQGKLLGYYTREDEYFCKGPHIAISPDNIRSVCKTCKSKIDFETLLTEVMVHELGHAMMDRYCRDSKAQNCSPRDIFSKAMEESLANTITLFYFQKDSKKCKDVRCFIEKDQPVIYQFGAYQFDVGVDWTKWRDSDKNMPSLKDWFDKCFSDGKIRKPLDYSISDYDKVFE